MVLNQLTPTRGPIVGGTVVTIYGENFRLDSTLMCRFGVENARASYINSTTVRCTTPVSREKFGIVDVTVTNNLVDYSVTSLQFQYERTSKVISISPSGGFLSGGTEVELTVESLARTNTLSCKFGNVGVVPAQYIARHILKCISPPSLKAAQVPVEVSSNGVDYTADLVQFHYQRKAIVTAIAPTLGPISGYTIVNIYGVNFVDSSSLFCAFGESVPSLWQRKGYRPSTQCTYIENMHSDNSTCPATDAQSSKQLAFTCFVRAHWIAANHIQCIAPPFQQGTVTIKVTNNDMDYSTTGAHYTYIQAIDVYSVSPSFGAVGASTSVTVHGSGFVFSRSLYCRFGLLSVAAMYVNSTTVVCTAPDAAEGVVDVRVSSNGVDYSE